MNLIRFAVYLFFRYYSEGKYSESEGMALFRAKGSMTLFLFINFLTLLAIFDSANLLPDSQNGKTERRLIMGLILLPFYLILTAIIRRKHLHQLREQYNNDSRRIYKANIWLIVYIIGSMGLLITISVLKK